MKTKERSIAVRDFYGPGKHIYEDQLGWSENERSEARSNVSKEIFEFEVLKIGLNMAFYYIDNDTFYEIFGESTPVDFIELPRNRDEPYIGWQSDVCHWSDEGKLIRRCEREEDVWDGIIIDGKPLDEIISRSFIISLN